MTVGGAVTVGGAAGGGGAGQRARGGVWGSGGPPLPCSRQPHQLARWRRACGGAGVWCSPQATPIIAALGRRRHCRAPSGGIPLHSTTLALRGTRPARRGGSARQLKGAGALYGVAGVAASPLPAQPQPRLERKSPLVTF